MSVSPELPPKKDVMLALLEHSSVFIHLDPRIDDVRVPPWFKKQPQLVLQVGLNMAVRIPDLDVGEDAVSCTLSFNRSPFFCYMPWKAVFALVAEDGKAMIWPSDIPKEVAAQQAERAQREQAKAGIRAVPSGPEAADANAKKAEPAKSAKKRGGKARAPKPEPREAPTEGVGRPAEAPSPAASGAAHTNGASGARARSGQNGEGGREKRPLPSYLRVVK